MINLQTCAAPDVYNWGRDLFLRHKSSQSTFEGIAQVAAKDVFDTFRQADNAPQFSLVRIFRFVETRTLPPELAQEMDSHHSPWMALAGTFGIEADWRDRHRSKQHQLLNLGHEPNLMAQTAYEQIGLHRKLQLPAGASPEKLLQAYGDGLINYFFVPQAEGSPFLPQQDFVKQYGIRSTVGIGSPFLSGSFYFLLAFSQTAISRKMAQLFSELTPCISTLFATYDHEPLWSTSVT